MEVSEKTMITALVNLKCVGKLGKCLTHFSLTERGEVLDEMIARGWLTENCVITPKGDEVVRKNLKLVQY